MLQESHPLQVSFLHFNWLLSSAHSSLHSSVGCAVGDIDTEGTAVVGDVVGSPVGAIVGAQNEQSLQLGLAHLNRLSSSAHSSSQLSGSMIQLSGQSSR